MALGEYLGRSGSLSGSVHHIFRKVTYYTDGFCIKTHQQSTLGLSPDEGCCDGGRYV